MKGKTSLDMSVELKMLRTILDDVANKLHKLALAKYITRIHTRSTCTFFLSTARWIANAYLHNFTSYCMVNSNYNLFFLFGNNCTCNSFHSGFALFNYSVCYVHNYTQTGLESL